MHIGCHHDLPYTVAKAPVSCNEIFTSIFDRHKSRQVQAKDFLGISTSIRYTEPVLDIVISPEEFSGASPSRSELITKMIMKGNTIWVLSSCTSGKWQVRGRDHTRDLNLANGRQGSTVAIESQDIYFDSPHRHRYGMGIPNSNGSFDSSATSNRRSMLQDTIASDNMIMQDSRLGRSNGSMIATANTTSTRVPTVTQKHVPDYKGSACEEVKPILSSIHLNSKSQACNLAGLRDWTSMPMMQILC